MNPCSTIRSAKRWNTRTLVLLVEAAVAAAAAERVALCVPLTRIKAMYVR